MSELSKFTSFCPDCGKTKDHKNLTAAKKAADSHNRGCKAQRENREKWQSSSHA